MMAFWRPMKRFHLNVVNVRQIAIGHTLDLANGTTLLLWIYSTSISSTVAALLKKTVKPGRLPFEKYDRTNNRMACANLRRDLCCPACQRSANLFFVAAMTP
ncbi:hypothetical protein D917_08237 [Trichinella nativa]|uniref:Uncharacterized protein n=1 Tax=Trichinella nativa TaxID=6335 RepID=A0A1Y3EPU2_9BILA|nr:hypothetical protein D917_08237 [Trichinella nativa]